MSRSVTDATRFTATSPHAYAKPTSIIPGPLSTSSTSRLHRTNLNAQSISNVRGPPPPIDPKKANAQVGETAAEKVARLRAARLREREAQMTTWDRVVIKGRVWADTAHKVTVLGLAAFSVVAVAVAGFAITDMIVHNRRKRNAFYAERHALYSRRVLEAIEVEKSGRPLDDDQTLVLNRERARLQAEEIAKSRSWRAKIKGLFIGGLKTDEEAPRETGVAIPSEEEVLQRLGVSESAILERVTQAERERERNSGVKAATTTATEVASTAAAMSTANSNSDDTRGEAEGSSAGDGSRILQAVADERNRRSEWDDERLTTVVATTAARGGPLDRMADGAVRAAAGKIQGTGKNDGSNDSNNSWTSWWTGK